MSDEPTAVTDLQNLIGDEITFRADPRFHQEKYDMILNAGLPC